MDIQVQWLQKIDQIIFKYELSNNNFRKASFLNNLEILTFVIKAKF